MLHAACRLVARDLGLFEESIKDPVSRPVAPKTRSMFDKAVHIIAEVGVNHDGSRASALEVFYRETAGVVGEVPLHEPCFRGNESRYLSKCTESGWVSSVGAYVDESETAIAKKCNTAYGVAAASGTAALHATGGVL